MQKRAVFFAGAGVCLLAAGWLWYEYQKPRTNIRSQQAAYTIAGETLYHEYSTDEKAANAKYIGKVLVVTGTVADVQRAQQGTTVLLAAGNESSGVLCSFPDASVAATAGEQMRVKGRCTGFLMDVNLVDATKLEH